MVWPLLTQCRCTKSSHIEGAAFAAGVFLVAGSPPNLGAAGAAAFFGAAGAAAIFIAFFMAFSGAAGDAAFFIAFSIAFFSHEC